MSQIYEYDKVSDPVEERLHALYYGDCKLNGRHIKIIIISVIDLARAGWREAVIEAYQANVELLRTFQNYLKEQTTKAKEKPE